MRIRVWSSDVCSSDLLHADIAVARADGRTAAKLDVEVLVAQCRAQVDLSTVLHRRRTEGLEPFEGRIGKRCSNRSGGIEVVHPGAAQGGDQLCAVRQADPARHVCSQEAAGACQALVFEGGAKRTRLSVRCAARLLIASIG